MQVSAQVMPSQWSTCLRGCSRSRRFMGWSMYEQLVFALFVEQQMSKRLPGSGWAVRLKVMKDNRLKGDGRLWQNAREMGLICRLDRYESG